MKTTKQYHGVSQTLIALAILAAFGPARAEDDIAQLIKPESSVSVGVGGANGDSKDRAVFGQYNGMRDKSGFLLLDVDYVTRDDATGTWTILKGLNLGLDSRELGFTRQKQGDWKFTAEYGELERDYPRTINTGLVGAGSTTPTVVRLATPGSGADIDLKTKRKAAALGFDKWVTPSLQLEVSFKNEEKNGARLWGRGYDCASYVCGTSTTTAMNQALFVKNAILLLPEPIDSTTRQIDAKANFHTDNLFVTAGYYGSFYTNSNNNLTPTVPNLFNNGLGQPFPGYPAVTSAIIAGGGTSLQNVLQLPMALPPDNQAHQFYLDGNYSFSPKTKLNFKYAYTRATQDDNFASRGLTGAPAGVSSLDAKVESTLAQVGFTAHPIDKLSLSGNVRYEKKDDKTPTAQYNVEPNAVVPATTPATYVNAFWDNNNTSSTKQSAKLEGTYRMPAGFRGTLGLDYNSIEREVPTAIADEKVAGLGALREKNHESGYRFELRRSLSETLNGGISYSSSRRKGSDWTSLSTLNPATPGISANNLALINLYCGGVACYGQQIPATSILGINANTPFPMSQTDLQRDKWKFSADWNPSDRVNVQLAIEDGTDRNDAPVNSVAGGKGWRNSGVKLYSLDVSLALTETWKMTAYASHGDQVLHVNHSTGYMADLNNRNDTAGIGLRGNLTGKIDVGADLTYLNDVNMYDLAAASSTSGTLPGPLTVVAPTASNVAQAARGLPDASFRQLSLKLFGNYELSKKSALRVDLIHQRVSFHEWQWGYNGVPFTYADNTTVSMKQDQNVTYVGVAYVYKF